MLQYVTYYSFFREPCLPFRTSASVSRILGFLEVIQQRLAIHLPNGAEFLGLNFPVTNKPSKMVRMVPRNLDGLTCCNPLFIHEPDSTVLPCLCNWHFYVFNCKSSHRPSLGQVCQLSQPCQLCQPDGVRRHVSLHHHCQKLKAIPGHKLWPNASTLFP